MCFRKMVLNRVCRQFSAALMTWMLASANAAAQDETVPRRFSVAGKVLSADKQPVVGSIVIPLTIDGAPHSSDGVPLDLNSLEKYPGDEGVVLFAETDQQGRFQLELQPGKYRLVAQSWLDREAPVTNVLGRHGSTLRMDGSARFEFETEMNATEEVVIHPSGTGAVTLRSQEAGDLLLFSTEPLACDPVLAFMALTGTYWQGLLGGTAMEDNEMLITGLPEGDIHFFSFVNDNNGGWGGVTAKVKSGAATQVDLPLIAGWSNGHRDPPPELAELTEYFANNPAEGARVKEILSQLQKQIEGESGGRLPRPMAMTAMASHLKDPFELADGRTITFADAWAASTWAEWKERK